MKLWGSLFFPSRESSMSIYSVKGKGFRYDFMLKGEEVHGSMVQNEKGRSGSRGKKKGGAGKSKTGNGGAVTERTSSIGDRGDQNRHNLLDLVNLRLDFISTYKTPSYYDDNRYLFKRLVRRWGRMSVDKITGMEVQKFILERAKQGHYAANYDLRLLKALFNHGIQHKLLAENPVRNVPFLPVEKRAKYVPPPQDIDKIIALADPDTQDYLWTIRETMGRMGEINRLTWDDVDLKNRTVTLYTRKKQGGHLTPRRVSMTKQLFEVLNHRWAGRDPKVPWVFWHKYRCRKTGEIKTGPYIDRKSFMKTLCERAEVRYFRFHAFRPHKAQPGRLLEFRQDRPHGRSE